MDLPDDIPDWISLQFVDNVKSRWWNTSAYHYLNPGELIGTYTLP